MRSNTAQQHGSLNSVTRSSDDDVDEAHAAWLASSDQAIRASFNNVDAARAACQRQTTNKAFAFRFFSHGYHGAGRWRAPTLRSREIVYWGKPQRSKQMMKKTVTRANLAAHLFCDVGTVDSYRLAGVIRRLPGGGFDLDDCRKRALEHLRAKAAGRTGGGGDADLSRARASLAQAQTETAVIKNQLSRGELVHVAVVRRIVETDFATVREQILSVAGATANEIATRARDAATVEEATAVVEMTLTDIAHELLSNLSSPEKIAAAAANKVGGNGHTPPHTSN